MCYGVLSIHKILFCFIFCLHSLCHYLEKELFYIKIMSTAWTHYICSSCVRVGSSENTYPMCIQCSVHLTSCVKSMHFSPRSDGCKCGVTNHFRWDLTWGGKELFIFCLHVMCCERSHFIWTLFLTAFLECVLPGSHVVGTPTHLGKVSAG